MTDPTPQEIARVKRWECEVERGHHDLEIVQVFGSNDPTSVMCSNCGVVWEIGRPHDDLVKAIIVIGSLERIPRDTYERSDTVIQIDERGARIAKHDTQEGIQLRVFGRVP